MTPAKPVWPVLLCPRVLCQEACKAWVRGDLKSNLNLLNAGNGRRWLLNERKPFGLSTTHLTLYCFLESISAVRLKDWKHYLWTSCIDRDTVTNASFNTRENFWQVFILPGTKKSLRFSTQESLQSKWITHATLLISKFSAQCSFTENSLYNCKQEFLFNYTETPALIPGGKLWMHNIIAL